MSGWHWALELLIGGANFVQAVFLIVIAIILREFIDSN